MLHNSIVQANGRPSPNPSSRRTCRPGRRKGIGEPVSPGFPEKIVRDHLELLDSPRALTVWLLFKYQEHAQLVRLTCDPHHYNDSEVFRSAYAATKFLSKCVGLKTGINTKDVAIESARDAETSCKATNDRIKLSRKQDVSPNVAGYLYTAKRIISSILGPLPESFIDPGWSPGRTSVCSGHEVTGVHKYAGRLDVTVSARKAALCLLRDTPLWVSSVLNADGPCSALPSALVTVRGNTMITVPKSAKTDRTICYEPHMNIRLQLAVGSYLKRRLSKSGVNLYDQSINQRRCREASITGLLSTIDLSMASDTLSLELVWELLPIDWACLLDDLRSKYTTWPDGSELKNEKFSSMGNGFTFELESLVFYALASAVTSSVSVYGDDIIIPTVAYEEVTHLLSFCGFTVNNSKSFKTSYFRESCGADYFGGVDCTPFYLRCLPRILKDALILHNGVRSFYGRSAFPSRKASRMLRAWRSIHTIHLGPSGYGDGHYHVDFDEARPKRAGFSLDGWWFQSYVAVFRDNMMYGDRVSGHFSVGLGNAALCASLGPKRPRDLISSVSDRRMVTYKIHRGLANFCWPTIVWF